LSQTEKLQSLWIVAAIFIGLTLGQVAWLSENAVYWIVPSLIVMLYGIFLNISFNHLTNAFQNYKVTGLS